MKTITKLLLTILIFTSCSVQNNLLKVTNHYYKVVWCDYDHIYILTSKQKVKKINNIYHELAFVGDFLIIEN